MYPFEVSNKGRVSVRCQTLGSQRKSKSNYAFPCECNWCFVFRLCEFYCLFGRHLFMFGFLELSALWFSAVWIRVNRLRTFVGKFDTMSHYSDATELAI